MIKGMRQAAWNALHFASSALGFGIVTYRQPERLETVRAIRKLKASCEMVLTPLEASQLFSLVRSTSKLGGAMAEVGVFRGGSARLIRQADAVRPLHLFDTFEGLPEPARTDVEIHTGPFEKNEFSCSLEQVRHNLKSCANVHFHPGLFPETGKVVENEKFSFVHADVDLYASTRSVLEFFYPRLIPGAIILTHDFATAHGPHKAFTEFFENLPEPLIELSGDQAMVVKL
jgi:hypothetical protein